MEILNLPVAFMEKLFGNGAFFSNWVQFFIANWMALSLGGFILSNWMQKEPKGIIAREELSAQLSKNPNWALPFGVVGAALALLYNVALYALFLLLETSSFVTNFCYKWASKVVRWMWAEVFLPSVWMLAKIAFQYLISWPFALLLQTIQAVPLIFSRTRFMRTLWPTLLASMAAAILVFAGFYTENTSLAEFGPIICYVFALVWIVADVVYQTREAAQKALQFAFTIVGTIVAIYTIGYLLNFWDARHNWGASITALWHVPSVLAACFLLLMAASLLYLTNVGVFFANEDTHENKQLFERCYSYIQLCFKHALAFIYQPILAIVVAVICVIIPWTLLDTSANFAAENWVSTQLQTETENLNAALKGKNVLAQKDILVDPDLTKDAAFETAKNKLTAELELQAQKTEHERYMTYLSTAQKFGADVSELMSARQFDALVKADSLALVATKEHAKTTQKMYADQIRSLEDQIQDMNASINSNPELAEYLMPSRNESQSKLKVLQTMKMRDAELNEVYVQGLATTANEFSGNWFRYCLTYALFLMANYTLLAIIITFVFNLYAQTVKPVYEAHSGSMLVSAIREEQARNARQPWMAWLVLVAFILVYFQFSSLSKSFDSSINILIHALEEWSALIIRQ
ncbi:MAG: hypothetical protein RLZZ301_250 [Bacteroidota bacterium]|jgi:hypothetical protein